MWPKKVIEAWEEAKKARSNAYADYSGVKVGAALKMESSDKIYAGSNIEFCVNGVSVCAERSAISHAITIGGKAKIEFVVVCTNTEPVLYPCGVCMQALSEFADPELDIYVSNPREIVEKKKFKELFTHQYSELPKVLDE